MNYCTCNHSSVYLCHGFFTVQDRLISHGLKSCRYKTSIMAANQENIKNNKADSTIFLTYGIRSQ